MLQHITKLGKESFVFGLSSIVSKFLSFLLIPFFARKLSVGEYGEIALLNSIFFFLSTIATLGLDSAAFRWYYDESDEPKKVTIFNTWFVCQLVVTLFLVAALLLINPFFAPKFFTSAWRIYFIPLISFNLLCTIIPQITGVWYRVKRLPWMVAGFSFIMVSVSFLFSFVFVILLGWGVLGFFAGQSIGFLVAAFLGLWKAGSLFRLIIPDLTLLKAKIRYGLSILPATLAATTLVMATNFIIQSHISQVDLGLYQMGNNFAMLILLFTAAFSQAWPPFSFSLMGKPEAPALYAEVLNVYVYLLSFFALVLAVFAPEVLLLLTTQKFVGGATVTGILTYMYFINSLSVIAITGLSIVKQVQPYGPVVVACAVITVVLELLLVKFGKEAVSVALLIGQSLPPLILFHLAQKKFPIPYSFTKAGCAVLLSFLMFLTTRTIEASEIWRILMIKALVCFSFLIIIIILERHKWLQLHQLILQKI